MHNLDVSFVVLQHLEIRDKLAAAHTATPHTLPCYSPFADISYKSRSSHASSFAHSSTPGTPSAGPCPRLDSRQWFRSGPPTTLRAGSISWPSPAASSRPDAQRSCAIALPPPLPPFRWMLAARASCLAPPSPSACIYCLGRQSGKSIRLEPRSRILCNINVSASAKASGYHVPSPRLPRAGRSGHDLQKIILWLPR